MVLQPADPSWESIPIQNPHLESHLEVDEIGVGIALPGRRYITSFDPATGLHIGTFMADNEDEIQRKIKSAASAQKKWKRTTFTQRRRVVRSLMKWLVDNQEVCARVACRDSGKTREQNFTLNNDFLVESSTVIDAALGEILTTCSKMEWLLNHGEAALKPEKRAGNLMMSYKRSEVHYEPLGVVAALVSWNYRTFYLFLSIKCYLNSCRKIALHNSWSPILAAIFSGNGIVLKCSENVIWSTTWFVGAMTECLRACGHDQELIQVVCCYPEQAHALTKSPLIKHITFIGSEEVGRKVCANMSIPFYFSFPS